MQAFAAAEPGLHRAAAAPVDGHRAVAPPTCPTVVIPWSGCGLSDGDAIAVHQLLEGRGDTVSVDSELRALLSGAVAL